MLSGGYTHHRYYWEIVVMLRKATLMAITTFFAHYSILSQAYMAILTIVFALVIHVYCQPFETIPTAWDPVRGHLDDEHEEILNTLESMSLGTCFFTLYLGMLFFEFNDNSAKHQTIRVATSSFIMFLNVFFLLWITKEFLVQLHRETSSPFLEKVVARLQSCRSSAKRKKEEKEQQRADMVRRCKELDEQAPSFAEPKKTKRKKASGIKVVPFASSESALAKTPIEEKMNFEYPDSNDQDEWEGWTTEEDQDGFFHHRDGRRGYYDDDDNFVIEKDSTSKANSVRKSRVLVV